MASNSSLSSSGIGVAGLLGIVFRMLKLTGYIDWSWSFWGGFIFMLLILLVIGGIAIAAKW